MGWVLIIAGLGMILTLLSGDISNLNNWSEVTHPPFVAGVIAHIGAVLTAAVGGNLVPNLFKVKFDTVSDSKRAELT